MQNSGTCFQKRECNLGYHHPVDCGFSYSQNGQLHVGFELEVNYPGCVSTHQSYLKQSNNLSKQIRYLTNLYLTYHPCFMIHVVSLLNDVTHPQGDTSPEAPRPVGLLDTGLETFVPPPLSEVMGSRGAGDRSWLVNLPPMRKITPDN